MSSNQIPKEAKIVSMILNSSHINECEPKVISFLIEIMFSISFLIDRTCHFAHK